MSIQTQVAVIGGGPAGLAAALAAARQGVDVLLIEHQAQLHAADTLRNTNVQVLTQAFAEKVNTHPLGWRISMVTPQGMRQAFANAVVFATGCREQASLIHRYGCDAPVAETPRVPDHTLLETMRVPFDPDTGDLVCDEHGMVVPGIFCCGSAAGRADARESGEITGAAAACAVQNTNEEEEA
ncbi:MAG: FAD-dependent oxidoreductase [Oscillospiraceae bacterium]|nr:FAD-dependent oxidoreductase [Oscillospiraceae bacterium]